MGRKRYLKQEFVKKFNVFNKSNRSFRQHILIHQSMLCMLLTTSRIPIPYVYIKITTMTVRISKIAKFEKHPQGLKHRSLFCI
jgi:hypothetical protein